MLTAIKAREYSVKDCHDRFVLDVKEGAKLFDLAADSSEEGERGRPLVVRKLKSKMTRLRRPLKLLQHIRPGSTSPPSRPR
jgi:hypothetical protein